MSIQRYCMIPDCMRTRAPHSILCHDCWEALPKDVASTVWHVWNRDPDAEKAKLRAAQIAHDYFRIHSIGRTA